MIKNKVTASQFFSLLYLSLLSSVFMYISTPTIKISGISSVFIPIVFMLCSLIGSIPTFFVFKQFKQNGFNLNNVKKTRLLKLIAATYALIYFISALKTAARFDLFASSELFPGSDMTIFIVFIILICGLLSVLGLGALSRSSVIFAFLVVLTTVFVMLSLYKEIDILNFNMDYDRGVISFISNSLSFALQGAEIGSVLLFLPEIKGNVKKHYIWWVVLSSVSFSVLMFFVIGSLGDFADTQIFPTYTAVSIASFGLVERMDAFETAIWVLCVVEKISFYIFIVCKCLNYIFDKISLKVISTTVSLLLGLILVIISGNVELFGFFSYLPLIASIYVMVVIVLPITIFFYVRKISHD